MQETLLQPMCLSFTDQGTAGTSHPNPHPVLSVTGNTNNMEFIFSSSLDRNVDYLQLLMCISQSSNTYLPEELGEADKSACLEQHLVQLWTLVCGQQQRSCMLAPLVKKSWWNGYGSEKTLATNTPLFEDLMYLKERSFFTPTCFQMLPVAGSQFLS